MRRTRSLITALAASVVLAACGGGGSGDDDGPTALEPVESTTPGDAEPTATGGDELDEVVFEDVEREPLSAWEVLSDRPLLDDGRVTLDTALEAFDLVLGDLPGVEAPSVPSGEVGARSGTQALFWITEHADDLTDDQRAAIDAALAPAGTDATAGIAGVAAPQRGKSAARSQAADEEMSCTVNNEGVTADGEGAAQYRPVVDQELAKVEQLLGRPLGIPIYVTLGTAPEGSETHAWVSPQSPDCIARTATSCRMQLLTNQFESEESLRSTVAHEVVHCFQATVIPPKAVLTAPRWMTEGFAEYVGTKLHPISDDTNLALYFLVHDRQLFTSDPEVPGRTYDAQGFFLRLDEVGANPASLFEPALRLMPDSRAAFELLTAPGGARFAETWPTSISLDHARGPDWAMPSGPPSVESFFPLGEIVNGSRANIQSVPVQTKVVRLHFTADVVRITMPDPGFGRIGWNGAGDATLEDAVGADYCNLPGGCTCPNGDPGPSEQLPSPDALVALTGMAETAHIQVTGLSLATLCPDRPPAPDAPVVDPCLVGSWVSDEWTLPGPIPELTGVGGQGASVSIRRDGAVSWDFDGMNPLAADDPRLGTTTLQATTGTADGSATAADGDWEVEADTSTIQGRLIDNILGETPVPGGPGLYVMMRDGRYSCRGDEFTFTTDDAVFGTPVEITFHAA